MALAWLNWYVGGWRFGIADAMIAHIPGLKEAYLAQGERKAA